MSRLLRRHHRRVAWLCLVSMLYAATAPALSQWLAASGGTWVEICSANGLVRVALDAGGQAQPADDAADPGHCPFCRLQDLPAVLAMHGTADPRGPVAAGGSTPPPLPDGRPSWRTAQPRAPPLPA